MSSEPDLRLYPDDPDGIDTEWLAACLRDGPWQCAGHGETYNGRPATRVLERDGHFLKLHDRPFPTAEAAAAAIAAHRKREALLAVHPPGKQWFRWRDESGWLIGNRTPPLAICADGRLDVASLETILGHYFRAAREHGLALDLGLTNFGHDDAGRLWYVDDDLYAWTDHHPLHDFLCHLLRRGRLDGQSAAAAGRLLQARLDAAACDALCAAIDTAIMPAEQHGMRDALRAALTGAPKTTPRPATATVPTTNRKRLALIADVHGNLPALETVLAFIDAADVDALLVLGDVVGYGPHPEACVARLRERQDAIVIRGNHDNAVVTGEISGGTTSLANWSWEWTRDRLDADARAWLAALPCQHAEDDWLAVHGAPVDATYFNAYVYRMSYEDNLENLARRGIPLCFHGHTHLQQLYCRRQGRDAPWDAREGSLSDVDHALLSPGSVGQPRCGEPGAELAIIDLVSREFRFFRLAYDLDRTLADMRRHAFPHPLIERLQTGQ